MVSSRIFFFHIPKCAGTSVWKFLTKIYGRDKVFQIASADHVKTFNEEDADDLRRYAVIGGHHFLSTYQAKLGALDDYFKVTTLRDPIERIISNYNFIRRDWRHKRYREVRQSTFEDFAMHEAPNAQTKLLADNTDDLERAIDTLDNWFDFCTTSDRADLLMRKLSEVAGVPFKRALHKNASKRKVTRETLDQALVDRLEEIHSADCKLFEHIRARENQEPSRFVA